MSTSLDLDRITHPLRLAAGSHQRGSGKGCAMNVISYVNGDVEITDFPVCSARPLARLVQLVNDRLAGPDGYLSPEDSVVVLELGWQTVGTADVAPSVLHLWLAELLVNPKWGVIRHANEHTRPILVQVAELHRKLAAGESIDAEAAEAAAWAARAAVAEAAEGGLEFTRNATARWRDLAGLDLAGPADSAAVNSALIQMSM